MNGLKLIAAECERQVSEEGWTPEHDDGHVNGELAAAGACYAMNQWQRSNSLSATQTPNGWPWEPRWWKPTPDDRIRELVKAGALIAKEIDRLKRLQAEA